MMKNYKQLNINKIGVVLLAGILSAFTAVAQNIIPRPQQVVTKDGTFVINPETRIVVPRELNAEAQLLQQGIADLTGNRLPILSGSHSTPKNSIILRKATLSNGDESYHLAVTPHSVVIEANKGKGFVYGSMTLLQLLPVQEFANHAKSKPVPVRAVEITDFPRFKWRGLMLDVSRTFMSPQYLKRTIDRMAFYKLNILHLHLTDDQGWRIPVKSYPLLNQKASMFDASYHEPTEFQGFYIENDVKELVSYAALRNVELVPEIESPGHSHAPLFAYPELLCDYKISPIRPFLNDAPTVNDVFCVGNPASLKFFQSVISETAQLFPSGYLHLGGDEVPRNYWQSCAKCQALVRSQNLPNTSALQGYFMQQLHDFAVKSGKRPVAWDEILHDNNFLTKDWIIMSWTGSKPGLLAAAKGYDVVMTPTSHMYFDYGYDAINTEKIFNFDPFEGAESNQNLSKHILGIQANFWSHIDRTPTKTDYQLFPRLLGLAERAWSASDDNNYAELRLRKNYHRIWLDYMDVKYYTGDFN